jgi:hypothetical protein
MRGMIKTRGCKRCGGDLALERDRYGSYFFCIQCGAEYQALSQDVSGNGNNGSGGKEGYGVVIESQPVSAVDR